MNDTFIRAGLSGGLKGTFTLEVTTVALGNSMPETTGSNEFKYDFSISSISPTSGSVNGGTLITITGVNFSPDALDNLVFLGNELN